MAMVVKNNMSAINTLNTLNKNSSALSKSLQKVSSGMKINGAADDASGYAISERMRVQIRSLDQANQNTQNGSSMMKVAEGAVSSTVDILKTLKEKAVNAANDTNTDSDRQTIQKELDQSIDQINDNANVTFNGKYLVDGSKNTKGNATYTALTNQSLATSTTADTKLTDLNSRSGDSLEIHSTDKVTVSYVQGGKTYSTTFAVGADTTLQDVFNNAEDIDKDSQIFASASNKSVMSATNGEVPTEAEIAAKETEVAGSRVHHDAYVTAKNTEETSASDLKDLVKDVRTAVAKYNAGTTVDADKVANWDTNKSDNENLVAIAKSGGFDKFIADATYGGKAAVDAYQAELTKYNGATYDKDATVDKLTVRTGGYCKVTDDAKAAYTDTDKANLTTLVASKNVGIAASDDMVTTANGEQALTITANAAGVGGQISGLNISISDSQGNVKKSANAALDAFGETIRAQNKSEDNAISLQVGTNANQSIKVGLTDMRAEALGLQGSDGTKLNISTQTKANAAINVLDNAIQKALDQQTTIGAIESRLDYTSSNLTTASENVQASESTIRDADMAKEMTNYTKNNVLLQAAQSMLAQANQSSSNVLSLLQ